MSFEVQLQRSLVYNPLAVEVSLPDSKLVLSANGRSASDFHLTLYKRSDDYHLRAEQRFLYLTRVYQLQPFKMLLSRLGLGTALRRPASCLVTWK
ncbi:hypothetical protein TNCV_2435861 [Trichonephila clavipes]|nr:hypothetical protein TNCV_2435861 [Trichonephila clavipes]